MRFLALGPRRGTASAQGFGGATSCKRETGEVVVFDFLIQYRSFLECGEWTTIGQDSAVDGRAAVDLVSKMQKKFERKMGKAGAFRVKPIQSSDKEPTL